MNAKVCDRCGKMYIVNTNDRFISDGITGVNLINEYMNKTLKYDLCDDCCRSLFEFLELTDFAVKGHSIEDVWFHTEELH